MAKMYGVSYANKATKSDQATILGDIEKTGSGNVRVRIGTVYGDNGEWTQTGYVVLSPEERDALLAELQATTL